jgi:predicted metal-binding membrane protein
METGFGSAVPEGRAGWSSERVFLGISALLFIASVGGTIYWSRSMSGGMTMPSDMAMSSGTTVSMLWTKLPEQNWLSAAALFMAMWVVMMVAMMLPSLVPMLLSYRRSLPQSDQTRLGGLTALAGAGYFFVWAVFGAVAYPLGVAVATAEMQWMSRARLVPAATGVFVLLAGCLQLTAWKARQLECCRNMPVLAKSRSPDALGAWQYGVRLGVHCCLCCSGFMLILLVTGVMDLGIMAIVAAAITVERLAPKPERVARAAGVVIVVAGILMIVRALGIA